MIFLDILTNQYRKAGVLKAAGRGLSNSEQVEGLGINNALIDGMKIESLFFYQIVRTVFATVAGQKDYRIGPLSAGPTDWDIERPEHIERAGFIIPPSSPLAQQAEIPMEVFLSYEQYQRMILKDIPSNLPLVLYYRPTIGLGTVTLWPVPNVPGKVAIYTPGVVEEFGDVMDEVMFPQGYREFLEYAGGVAVHDNYPAAPMAPGIEQRAAIYRRRIKASQFQPSFMRCDPAAARRATQGNFGTSWLDVLVGPGGFY